ncbi:flagellar biosynthetic protein FliR [Clostridium grantii]|uniref:Flagellar biosynthetic protein FliR n=1 Tax=Clostridium grantii DSM 8605 TaxID=1121316 RepID=A0A1M5XIY6_9CLOT|nr:flagellar biosynthetic protein FliR [Clostridium grantii]SHH99770.1 flagellar biosynthetic protein FliR [Clostridium grantii DSM 8605]
MITLNFTVFFLILVRITSMFITTPLLNIKGLPNTFKIGFCIIIAYLVFINVAEIDKTLSVGMDLFVVLLIKEVAVGLTMGFAVNIVFMSTQMAGQFIDIQGGFSASTIFDPTSGDKLSIYGQIYFWLTVILYFILNGHYYLIIGVVNSFKIIDIGNYSISALSGVAILQLIVKCFTIAVQIAAPMILVFVISDLVLGIMSRTVPQLNVLMLGLPLKVLVGLFTFFSILPIVINLIGGVVEMIPSELNNIIEILSKGN